MYEAVAPGTGLRSTDLILLADSPVRLAGLRDGLHFLQQHGRSLRRLIFALLFWTSIFLCPATSAFARPPKRRGCSLRKPGRTPPAIWSGLCASSCALTLSPKYSVVDLTGKAKIRWFTKTSGFHEIRPVLKLADGNWLIGDHVDANTFDFHESEFFLSEVHWLKLDMPKVQTKGIRRTDR